MAADDSNAQGDPEEMNISREIRRLPARLQNRFVRISRRAKVPIDPEWQKPENWSTLDEILTWIGEGGNYGIALGSGLIGIDTDRPELAETIFKRFPKTFTVRTPGGEGHYHFIYRSNLRKTLVIPDPDDPQKIAGHIQGEGKQVVGPGSIHPNGRIYEVMDGRDPVYVSEDQIHEALWDWIQGEEEEKKSIEAAKFEEKFADIKIVSVVDVSGLKRHGDEYWGCHPIHGSTGGKNFWVNVKKNVWHCFRHGSGGGPLSWLAVREGIIRCEEAKKGKLRGELFKTVLRRAGALGFNIPEFENKKIYGHVSQYFVKDRFIAKWVADEIMTRHHFLTLNDTEEILVYEAGIYTRRGTVVIKEEAQKILGEEATTHRVNEVIAHIQRMTYASRDIFNQPLNLIPVKNGVLDILTLELNPHSPETHFLAKVPVEWDVNATCPAVEKFLLEVLRGEDIPVIKEAIGYTLYRDYRIQKAFMFLGEGANGKSTLLLVIAHLLGEENISSRSLQELSSDRFAAADLYGKLANL
ncbi:MAG: bifunctional DNA primase/polymerase, partial [Candidatus Bathyarchaeia archaeon]